MRRLDSGMVIITEGGTELLVPEGAVSGRVPPRKPAFFNPRARRNRDMSVIACASFIRGFGGPKVFLDGMAGLGARSLRVANEAGSFEEVVINDLNPGALELARQSAEMNGLDVTLSNEETCRFLAGRARSGKRGAIVDIDPFGSPAKFLDCAVRATAHKGLLCATATDLQVLNGLFQNACARRYGGTSIRAEFGNEVAIRLVLGCLRHITARLDVKFEPVFVESDQHYYRIFARIHGRPDTEENMGHVFYCPSCGNRGTTPYKGGACQVCGGEQEFAGPLWTGRLFEEGFVRAMKTESENLMVDKTCAKTIDKSILEAGMPAIYYTLDGVASKMGVSPPGLDRMIGLLRQNGFLASPTSLDPTGFRTDADAGQMREILT